MNTRELLVSTVQFYTSENRGTIYKHLHSGCQYVKSETSPGCAIGRFLSDEVCRQFDDTGSIYLVLKIEDNRKLLPDWMQLIPTDHLSRIQSLHDNEDHWDEFGITKEGKEYVLFLCEQFKVDPLTEEEFKHIES